MALGAFRLHRLAPGAVLISPVLMHLMALGAFRQVITTAAAQLPLVGLNAPYGARCFPTCFYGAMGGPLMTVLMHLMALGAFRLA